MKHKTSPSGKRKTSSEEGDASVESEQQHHNHHHKSQSTDPRDNKLATQELQQHLSSLGTPLNILVNFVNKNYSMQIGNQCNVHQLKLLISAYTGVPVPDMKLVCKGTMLKDGNELLTNTKLKEGSKLLVLSSGAHVV